MSGSLFVQSILFFIVGVVLSVVILVIDASYIVLVGTISLILIGISVVFKNIIEQGVKERTLNRHNREDTMSVYRQQVLSVGLLLALTLFFGILLHLLKDDVNAPFDPGLVVATLSAAGSFSLAFASALASRHASE